MPHMENWKEFKDVGQGGSSHDVNDKYDSYYGKYEQKQPSVKPAPASDPPAPFKLGGK